MTAPKDELEIVPVKSADRVLTLIELLTEHRDGLTFTQLQEFTSWPRSSLYGLVRTMADRNHLEFDPHSQEYRIGVRIWEAGQTFNSSVKIAELAMPYLQEAGKRLNETVQLAVLDGIENIDVAKVDSSHPLNLVSFVGARLPAYATGIGKVLLAGLDEVDLDKRLEGVELTKYTDTTILSMDRLRQLLRDIRTQGFAVDDEEYTLGVRCWAVPVLDVTGSVVAGISTSIPSARVSEGIEETALAVLTEIAGQISSQLGYKPPALASH
jgi:IclR family KDG regulon transcriptional repressor